MNKVSSLVIALTVMMQVQSAQAQNCSEYRQASEVARDLNVKMSAQMRRVGALPRKPPYDDGLCAVAKRMKHQWTLVGKLADPTCLANPDVYNKLIGSIAETTNDMNELIKDYCR